MKKKEKIFVFILATVVLIIMIKFVLPSMIIGRSPWNTLKNVVNTEKGDEIKMKKFFSDKALKQMSIEEWQEYFCIRDMYAVEKLLKFFCGRRMPITYSDFPKGINQEKLKIKMTFRKKPTDFYIVYDKKLHPKGVKIENWQRKNPTHYCIKLGKPPEDFMKVESRVAKPGEPVGPSWPYRIGYGTHIFDGKTITWHMRNTIQDLNPKFHSWIINTAGYNLPKEFRITTKDELGAFVDGYLLMIKHPQRGWLIDGIELGWDEK
ncbi:MAG: hypothetical protein ACTSRA_21020 [Promethearchaeota archaeon]